MKIPKKLQSVLWSTDINKLNLEKDKEFIVHQTLVYGDLDDLKWLFKTYTRNKLVHVFFGSPMKIYPKKIFDFIKNLVFDVQHKHIDEQNYLTSIFEPVRQRAARNIS